MSAIGDGRAVHLTLDIDKTDLKALQRFIRTHPDYRQVTLIARLSCVALASLVIPLSQASSWWLLPLYAWLGLSMWVRHRNGAIQLRASQALSAGPVTADGTGVRREGVISSHTPWTAWDAVLDTDDRILFRLTAVTGLAIPKRCFASTADVDQFLHLARTGRDGKPSA